MSNTLASVYNLPDVSFIDNDTTEGVIARLINNYESFYEQETGQKISLASGDPMRIALMACAYELIQIEEYVDRAGKQDLLKYSYGEFLDNIAASKPVTRQPASAATVTMRFTFSEPKPYVQTIPAGTRVTNGNGVYFYTEYAEAPANSAYVNVAATCTETGTRGNNFVAGQINVLSDPLPYVQSVRNINESGGGSDIESDDSFRERVYLYPSSYSTAGPADAYVYWAKTYSSAIGSVRAVRMSPGHVYIYFLMADGSVPTTAVREALQEYMDSENIRPMTDVVTVRKPYTVNFQVSVTYYIKFSDSQYASTIQERVEQAIDDYITWQTIEIGRDINPDELTRRIIDAGAKRCVISSPSHTIITETQVAQLDGRTVNYGGLDGD